MKEMILTQAIKSFIILAYYCYLHMRKLQIKKKKKTKMWGAREILWPKYMYNVCQNGHKTNIQDMMYLK